MRAWYRGWQIITQGVFCSFFQVRTLQREHVPATGPVLLVSNHQSFLDPPLCGVGLHRELDYIARDSLFRNRWFAWYIRSLNAFPIQRNSADLRAIRTIINRLRAGRAVVLFPEGTRTQDGRIRPFQSGIELIARKSQATTVPVLIDGAFETWPRHQTLPGLGRIYVWYGEPIPPERIRRMPPGQYVAEINERLRQMQNALRKRYHRRVIRYPKVKATPGQKKAKND